MRWKAINHNTVTDKVINQYYSKRASVRKRYNHCILERTSRTKKGMSFQWMLNECKAGSTRCVVHIRAALCVMIRASCVWKNVCVIWMDVSFVHLSHLVRQVGGKLIRIKANGSRISVIQYVIQTIIYRNMSNIGIWRVRKWIWVWFIIEWTPVNGVRLSDDKFFCPTGAFPHHVYVSDSTDFF